MDFPIGQSIESLLLLGRSDSDPRQPPLANAIIEFNSAESGERGLKVALETRPDFVLLDINLPGIDGYQVFKQLKRNGETKGIPVVAVTADALPESVEKLKAAGFQAFLTKPIDTRQLYTIVNRLCDPGAIPVD